MRGTTLRYAAVGLALAAGSCSTGPASSADVTISTSTNTGLNLDLLSGSSVDVLAGVGIGNAAFSTAVSGTSNAWALSNAGTITGTSASAVVLSKSGSSVLNTGSITAGSNGVLLAGGGSVDNRLGATITATASAISIGTTSAGPGTVTNAGTITQTGTLGDLVQLRFGGTVTNLATGQILANNSSNAVSVGQGASRTVDNAGTITNTGTGFAAGVLVQGGASTVTNRAGGIIRGSYNGVYASASAPLTLTNNGTIGSTGANAGSRAVEATGGGTIVNTGTIQSAAGTGLYFGGAGTITNIGTISGSVRSIQFGTSNVARTLILGTGSSLTGNVLGSTGSGVDTLTLEGTGTETLSRFSNFEILSMAGTAWALGGAGSFATSSTVASGTLSLTGTLTSPLIGIASGATLAGTGTLVGAVSNLGRVDVGTGTLSVTGSFASAAGARLAVGVTPAAAGRLSVTGTASLSGGQVDVSAAAGTYAPATTYTILTASSGLTGTFSGVTVDRLFLTPSLSYDATSVFLRLDRSLLSFASGGITRNQIATGAAMDTLPVSTPLVVTTSQLATAEIPAAFDQLSGEVHATLQGALAGEARLPREAALRLIEDSFAALSDGARDRRHFWAEAYGSAGVLSADGNAAATGTRTGGFMVGTDATLGDLVVNAFAGVGSLGLDVPDRSSSARIDQLHLGLVAGQAFGAFRLKTGVILTANAVSTTRTPGFTGFSATESAQYWTGVGQLFADLSYAIPLDPVTLSPFARLTLTGVSASTYTETGGSAGLTGGAPAYGTALASLGLATTAEFELADGLVVSAHASLALQQAFGSAPTASHTLPSSAAFTVAGRPADGTALLLEAGLSAELSATSSLDLSYASLLAEMGEAHTVRATFSGRF